MRVCVIAVDEIKGGVVLSERAAGEVSKGAGGAQLPAQTWGILRENLGVVIQVSELHSIGLLRH